MLPIILFGWICADSAQALIHIENEFNIVKVFRGEKAELTCRYNVTAEEDDWAMTWSTHHYASDGHSIYEEIFHRDPHAPKMCPMCPEKNTSYTDRVSVAFHHGEATLTIHDMQLNDDHDTTRDTFVFEIHYPHHVKACYFYLDVYVAPDPPVIKAVQSSVSVPSQSLTRIASCETRGGYPWPSIFWYRDDIHIRPLKNVAEVKTAGTKESDGSFTVRSDLYYNVTSEDKDAQFFCEVTFRVPNQVKTFRSQGLSISVYNSTTSLKLWIESPASLVTEGETVQMRCRGNGDRPTPVLFKKQGSDEELESQGDSLLLQKVTRNHSGEYECHSLGPDPLMTSLSLTVHYLNPAVTVPKDVAVVPWGDSLKLTCHAPSSLETSTLWLKDHSVFGEGEVLRLDKVTFDTAGQYNCLVSISALDRHTSVSVRVSVYADHRLLISVIVSVLLLLVLGGGVLYFLFQKGKISFGRSGTAEVGFLRFSNEQELLPFTNEQELDPSSCDQE